MVILSGYFLPWEVYLMAKCWMTKFSFRVSYQIGMKLVSDRFLCNYDKPSWNDEMILIIILTQIAEKGLPYFLLLSPQISETAQDPISCKLRIFFSDFLFCLVLLLVFSWQTSQVTISYFILFAIPSISIEFWNRYPSQTSQVTLSQKR